MGNLLRLSVVGQAVMAAKHTSGMRHPTVVPENFEPEESGDADGTAAAGGRRRSTE
jgi:hypothetical protein